MSDTRRGFTFTRGLATGDPCSCCGQRKKIEKVFVARADHPDGPISGAMTTFTPEDLRRFVTEAADYLNLEVRSRWRT